MLYREIVDADKIGFSADQIAAMKGWEKRTVDRYLSISRYPVMEKMLAEGMPYSKLASIADKLKSKPKLKEGTVAFFEKWLSKSVPGRRAKKREEAAKKNKDLKEEALQLGKLLEPGEYEGWIRDLDAGEGPYGQVQGQEGERHHRTGCDDCRWREDQLRDID